MSDAVQLPSQQADWPHFANPFYLLRHGETELNRDRRFQGQLDVELSDVGLAQARAAAKILSRQPIAGIVSSPLVRAQQTAHEVAERTGHDVETEAGLMECHLGVHQGLPYQPWISSYWKGDFAPEGGEDFWAYRARVVPALARVTAARRDMLVVAHGGLWIALRSLIEIEPDLDALPNALPLHVVPGNPVWTMRKLSYRPRIDRDDEPKADA